MRKETLTVDKPLELKSSRINMNSGLYFGVDHDWFYFRNSKHLSMLYIYEGNDYIRIGTGEGVDKPLNISATRLGIRTGAPRSTLDVNGTITATKANFTDVRPLQLGEWTIQLAGDQMGFHYRDKTVLLLNGSDGVWAKGKFLDNAF